MSSKKSTVEPNTENKAADQAAHGTHEPKGENVSQLENEEQEPQHQKPKASCNNSADKPGEVTGDAGGTVPDDESIPSSKPKPYGRHFRTVELATRLACAQINAEAYSRSTRLTVSGIQRVAAAFAMASARIKTDLEKLRSNLDLIEAAFVDRSYAELLSAAEINELPLDQATPLNHPDHDDLFEGAMFRAQRLLRPSTEDTTVIHAEQMFDAEEILSETQVGKRFEGCEWPGLSNREYFYEFIVRVERWFHDHLGRLNSPEEDEQYAEDAEMMGYVLDLGRRRQENDLFRKIYDLVRTHELPDRSSRAWSSTDGLSHATWTECLIKVIFCERRPSQARENERRTVRRYRPWGLFRFLRIFGADDPVGSELLESLACELRNLTKNAVVYPFRQNYPRTTDFGPLDRLVRERELDEMRKSSIQSAVKLEAASGLLDSVQTVETLPKPIDQKFQKEVLRSARLGRPFDPKWTETIKDGFMAILLSGTECHMDRMIGFLTKFYLPLLDAYGALDAVAEHRYSHHYPHELIDLLPDGWTVSLSRMIPESASPPVVPAAQAENENNSRAAEAMTLTLRSGAGVERSVTVNRTASLDQTSPDETSDNLPDNHGVDETATL